MKRSGIFPGLEVRVVKMHSRNWEKTSRSEAGSVKGGMALEEAGGMGRDQTVQGCAGLWRLCLAPEPAPQLNLTQQCSAFFISQHT